MSLNPDWLVDIQPNPYAEQLSRGYRLLRFAPDLESRYRVYMLRETLERKRVALIFALLAWLAFTGIDILMIEGLLLALLLTIRASVVVLLLVCWRMLLGGPQPHRITPLTITCIAAMGFGAAAVIALGHRQDSFFPYEGLLLVCMGTYFLAGLRLMEASVTCFSVLLAYGGFEWLGGLQAERLANNLLFLFVGNLIGAVGCYLLEIQSREQFLVSGLFRVLAERDGLTGLYNRRSFDRELARRWRQAQREGASLALLLCDVDHFKAYNDHYGHPAGDRALQCVGETLQGAARRPLDIAARLGGEEFAVLLYDIQADEAHRRGEVLRQEMEARAIEHAGSQVAAVLTLSIGVCCLHPSADQSMDSLFVHADRALYEAKAFGRNQVVT